MAFKEIEIMAFMISVFETVGAEGHTLGDPAGTATEGPKIRRPNQTTEGGVVENSHITGEIVVGLSTAHEPTTPIYGVLVINTFLRM